MNQVLRVAYGGNAGFADWLTAHSYFGEFSFHVLQGGMWVLVAYLFAGVQPFTVFVRETGFAKRFTFSDWLFATGAIGLALLDLYFIQKGWGEENAPAKRFYRAGQVVWLTHLAQSALLAPFVEETVMRGFLYRAFRGSYGLFLSSLLVLCFQSYFHWGLIARDLTALVFMIAFGAILCVIRERTQNTWSCVLFHAVYNLTVLRQWLFSVIAMVILLLLCYRSLRTKAA